MFVIKATLKDETRRLTFDSSRFPAYGQVQHKLRTLFNLPSTAQTYWVNVLLFPDDAHDARIMFKRHVCEAAEYEAAQTPFLHNPLPSPALVFTVLLSSDPRLDSIHGYHRANTLLASAGDLAIHISAIEEELAKRVSLLTALEAKLTSCQQEDDKLGVAFWTERVTEKNKSVKELEEEMLNCQKEFNVMNDKLNNPALPDECPGLTLRQYAEIEEREEVNRAQQTEDELAAWKVSQDNETEGRLFPPLENIFPPSGPRSRRGRRGMRHSNAYGDNPLFPPPPGPPPFFNHHNEFRRERHGRNIFDRMGEVLGPNSPALVPAQEIKTMLDGFLVNLSNQLASTFEGAPRVATNEPEAEPLIPGAYTRNDAQTQTAEAQSQPKPQAQPTTAKKSGSKGGFRHRRIWCDGCEEGIHGVRYKCEQCPDYDLCGSCLPLLHTSDLHPPEHTFRAMLHRDLVERIKLTPEGKAEEEDRHPASCDICSLTISGVRWKCLNCPDWDCCNSCSASVAETHPGHSFVKLHKSSDFVTNAALEAMETVKHPHIVCDGCDKQIYGPRYKCMHPDCPDYDLCEDCEASPFAVHPQDHPMLKTKVPLKVDFASSFDRPVQTSDIPRSNGRRHHGRHAHGDAFGPRRGCHWRQHDSPSTTSGSRWQQPVREHVTQATQVTDPIVPGSYIAKNIYDQEESVSNLKEPLVPDNKAKEEDVKAEPEVEVEAEVKTEPEAKVEVKIEPAATISESQTPNKEPVTAFDIFTWVRHVTIPPGCTLPAGAEFTKTWRLKHFASGSEYDFDTVKLVHKSDGLLSDKCDVNVQYTRDQVKDDDEVEVTIDGLKVPNVPGEEVVEHWRFEDEQGRAYGQPLRLRFMVETKSAPQSLSSSAVIMPSHSTTPSPSPKPPTENIRSQLASSPLSNPFLAAMALGEGAQGSALSQILRDASVSEATSPSLTADDTESLVSFTSGDDFTHVSTTDSGAASAVDPYEEDDFEVIEGSDEEEELTADEL